MELLNAGISSVFNINEILNGLFEDNGPPFSDRLVHFSIIYVIILLSFVFCRLKRSVLMKQIHFSQTKPESEYQPNKFLISLPITVEQKAQYSSLTNGVSILAKIYIFFITSIYLIEDYPAHKALWGFPHIIMLHVIVI